jgi:hypothetical protein
MRRPGGDASSPRSRRAVRPGCFACYAFLSDDRRRPATFLRRCRRGTATEHSSDLDNIDIISLSGPLRGDRALEQLLAPSVIQAPDTKLCLNAHTVESIDVVAATATRMRIARHLREHPEGSVTIWLPGQAAAAARLYDILRPLPARVQVAAPPSQAPGHFTLLPATPVVDGEAARLVSEVVLDACLRARIARCRAGFITRRRWSWRTTP